MGVDYRLACATCKEFIDLHKWPVVEDAGKFLVHAHYKTEEYESQLYPKDSPYPFLDLGTLCKKIVVTSKHIRDALAAGPPDQEYIRKLTPIVEQFADRHERHETYLSCDMGDPDDDPWSPTQNGFGEWLEIPGAFNFYHYLPRNLTEVLGLRTWDDVVIQMKDVWPYVDGGWHESEIDAIRSEFERRGGTV